MPIRTETYVCFDADTDIHYYRLMQAWDANKEMDFYFDNAHELNSIRATSLEETIKRKLRERMARSKILIVLIGKNTKNLYKFVRWEIEIALEDNIPIIAVNLNGKRNLDSVLCPPILKDELAVHTSFEKGIIKHALESWPDAHHRLKWEGKSGPYFYNDSIYDTVNPKPSKKIA